MDNILDPKLTNSRKSLIELGKLLTCESCWQLADSPHVSNICEHTFCSNCVENLLVAGKCPVCQKSIDSKSCRLNNTLRGLVQAYKGISSFLNVENEIEKNSSTVDLNESVKNLSECASFQTPNGNKKRIAGPYNEAESLDNSVSVTTPGSKIDKRNAKGETALQVACVKGNLSKARELLQLGANANTQDNAGWTPLHEAVCGGIEDLVQLLLQNGANPNIPGGNGQNQTPLHDAAFLNKSNIVKLLLAIGADVNARNADGKIPREICSDPNIIAFLDASTPATTTTTTTAAAAAAATSTSSAVTQLPVGQPIFIYGLNLEKKVMQRYSKLSKSLGFKIVNSYSSKVTHVLLKVDDPHIKTLPNFYSAVLHGQWLVDQKWIEDSEKMNCLTDPSSYELTGALSKAPAEGSMSRLNAVHQLPGLFNNCRFYLNGQFDSPNRADLTLWIKNGCGTILTRMPNPEAISPSKSVPYHANPSGKLSHCSHFVLYDPGAKTQPSILYNMNHLKTLPVLWLVACLENFALVDPFL